MPSANAKVTETDFALPAFASAKVPCDIAVTVSEPTKPVKPEVVTLADVLPSYVLFAALIFVMVSALRAISTLPAPFASA